MTRELEQKLIDLEINLGLLQRDFEKQNEMVLLDKRRIDLLEQAVARLTSQLDAMRIEPARTLLDDKPPHY
ncbi:MAG: SlyX family protein [Pirellulaceae bacterium]|nr:SlyX family protein [Pirellulaceae bacterium]